MLRITTHEGEERIEMKLEGRIAGPWVAELSRAWMETAPQLAERQVSLDLRDVTYADSLGKQALRQIHAQSGAKLIVSTPWTQQLAEEIRANKSSRAVEEVDDGNDA